MNARARSILEEALGLDAEQRSALAMALLDSVQASHDVVLNDAWRDEIRSRYERLVSGDEPSIPWDDVKRRILMA